MTAPTSHELLNPKNYIEKIDKETGEVLPEAIEPQQLLVHAHRDYHPADVSARFMMSRLLEFTGDADLVRGLMKQVRTLGHNSARTLTNVIPFVKQDDVAMTMFGLKDRPYSFRFKKHPLSHADQEIVIKKLQAQGKRQLNNVLKNKGAGLRVLLTGGTGFLGQEIMAQVANNPLIEEMVVVIRPKVIKNRKTGEIIRTISPAERGTNLLSRLGFNNTEERQRFRFIAGDIEEAFFGINQDELALLTRTITHVIHCAASVSFAAPYAESFQANVVGTLNALQFSKHLQNAKGSTFVSHISIETSYIHGRQSDTIARENEMVFPNNFYNNYYELTKAMASMETERVMLDDGLRVVQLCPSIVIGDARTGNNRGDMKVVNAPVNAFGRAHQALSDTNQRLDDRMKGWAIAQMACVFPGDGRARLNLVPVDRVAAGIVASLDRPKAIGERIHLATNNFISSRKMRDICQEELNVRVRLAEPTLHRNITLPVMTKVLTVCKQPKLANALEKLGAVFGSYGEWGQPIHQVGNDVSLLGLEESRPNTEHAFRMLCRHNSLVQNFGQLRDADELARRERVWDAFVRLIEDQLKIRAGSMSPTTFQNLVEQHLDLENFILKNTAQLNQQAA